jgi:hypothetical protein
MDHEKNGGVKGEESKENTICRNEIDDNLQQPNRPAYSVSPKLPSDPPPIYVRTQQQSLVGPRKDGLKRVNRHGGNIPPQYHQLTKMQL